MRAGSPGRAGGAQPGEEVEQRRAVEHQRELLVIAKRNEALRVLRQDRVPLLVAGRDQGLRVLDFDSRRRIVGS